MTKPIHKAASYSAFLQSILFKLICVAACIYLLMHYQENPVVIMIAFAVCAIGFLLFGNEEIIIYPDKIVKTDTSFWTLLFRQKGKVFHIHDIKSASLAKPPDKAESTITEIGVAVALVSILPDRNRRHRNNSILIDLTLKNGEVIQLSSGLGKKSIDEVIKVINSLTR